METRTVFFQEPFKAILEREEVREPGPGEVLIKSLYSLISTGTELTAYTGSFPQGSLWASYVKYPFKAGYSSVGQIAKVGEGVKHLAEGDIVVCDAPHTEFYIWKADKVVKVPPGVDSREASFHTLGGGVMNCVRVSGVKLGESVVVVGAGLLGQLAVQFARLSGGFPVISVDLADFRLELAKKSGADLTVNPKCLDVFEAVRDATNGRMADVLFEVTGDPQVLSQAIRLVRKMGRFIVLGSPRGVSALDFHDEVNSPSRVIIGTHFYTLHPDTETLYYPWTWTRDRETFLGMLSTGRVSVNHLISHVYSFDEAPDAYRLLYERRHECMGVLLRYM